MPLVAAFLIGNAAGGLRGLAAFRQAADTFESLSGAVDDLRRENAGLRAAARRLREDPGAIESLARRELGLIRPGEKLFILAELPPDGAAPPGAP